MWRWSNKLIDRYPLVPSGARIIHWESRVSPVDGNESKEGLQTLRVFKLANYLLTSSLCLRPRVVFVEGSGGVTLRFLEGGFWDFGAACFDPLVRLVLRDVAGFAGAGFAPSGRWRRS